MTRFTEERDSCDVPLSVAAWSARGVPRTTLSGPGYQRTTYGFYRRTGRATTTAQRIVDVAARLPAGALVAGWAAAYVHGVDQLDGLDDFTMKPLPVPVLLAPRQRRRSMPGITYRQSTRRAPGRVVEGIP